MPASVVDAAAKNEVLQIVVFTLLFALGVASIGERGRPSSSPSARRSPRRCSSVTGFVMKFAPFGVGAAIAVTVASEGIVV